MERRMVLKDCESIYPVLAFLECPSIMIGIA